MGDSEHSSAGTAIGSHDLHITTTRGSQEKRPRSLDMPSEFPRSPMSPAIDHPPMPFKRHATIDLDDYFVGPRDMSKHSKWPLFLQMHGSILPKMIVPLFAVGIWSSAITVFSLKYHDIGIESVLLTVLGFLVGMGLSFRSSTAYERYAEGRKYWATLIQASQSLGRVFWIHARDVPDCDNRQITLEKVSAMNMVVAFCVSLKHMLRFEPYTAYADLQHLIGHLNTFAVKATNANPDKAELPKKKFFKEIGEYLGVSFAASNPRKQLKKSKHPLGNLPLEIINHLSIVVDEMVTREQLPIPMTQTLAYNNLALLNDVLGNCERILSTPLPIAYGIAISQITWVYVLVLPFQLVNLLEWVTIPASIVASYILLGLHLIGREIENPFGQDVNDLPLEMYCEQVAHDLDVIASYDKQEPTSFLQSEKNIPLYPVSSAPMGVWLHRSEDKLRDTLRSKPATTFSWRMGGARETDTAPVTPGDHNV